MSPLRLAKTRAFPSGGIRPQPAAPAGVRLDNEPPLEHKYGSHSHFDGQLIFATRGVLIVDVGGTRWIAPQLRAIWVPPRVVHALRYRVEVELCSVYFGPALSARAPDHVCAVAVSPLLRELAQRANGSLELGDSRDGALATLIADEFHVLSQTPLSLPVPTDRRLAKLCEKLQREPHCDLPLDALAREIAISPRHLARRFRNETGMSVAAWRQQLRLSLSLVLLAEGASVTQAAHHVGYKSATTYASTFKRAFGVPPSQYFGNTP
jgi:AraC-like DNA-binding protein